MNIPPSIIETTWQNFTSKNCGNTTNLFVTSTQYPLQHKLISYINPSSSSSSSQISSSLNPIQSIFSLDKLSQFNKNIRDKLKRGFDKNVWILPEGAYVYFFQHF